MNDWMSRELLLNLYMVIAAVGRAVLSLYLLPGPASAHDPILLSGVESSLDSCQYFAISCPPSPCDNLYFSISPKKDVYF